MSSGIMAERWSLFSVRRELREGNLKLEVLVDFEKADARLPAFPPACSRAIAGRSFLDFAFFPEFFSLPPYATRPRRRRTAASIVAALFLASWPVYERILGKQQ